MKKCVITNRSVSALLLLLVFAINSCKKGDQELHFDGDFGIKINMQGLASNSVQNGKVAKKSGTTARTGTAAINAQQAVIPFGDDLMLKATLKPDIDVDAVMAKYKGETAQGTGNKAAGQRAAAVSDELGANIAYRVMAYNSAGALVASRTYQYKGLNLEEDDLNTGYEDLLVGETYTFVVYSVNTEATGDLTASISNEGNLSTAAIAADTNSDLLYFKEDVEIKEGVNYLNVRLKHQFSQVTAVLSVDESMPDLVGTRIYGINQVAVLPSYSNGSLTFSDGSLNVQNEITNGAELAFPNIDGAGVNLLTSTPIRLISNGDDASFSIGALTINDITNNLNLTHFGTGANREPFTIQPGVRYTLQLEIAAPCTQIVSGSAPLDIPIYSSGPSQSETFVFTGADHSGEIDIYKIDNSFNMTINGEPLYIGSIATSSTSTPTSTNEIQFQGFGQWPDATHYPNIEFADGTRWGETGPSWSGADHEIWNFDGITNSEPIIRIQIDKDGIAMYGSKNLSGGAPFFPLRLINEENVTTGEGTRYIRGRFNQDVKWAQDGNNTIEVSQIVMNDTEFHGFVRGKMRIPCTTP